MLRRNNEAKMSATDAYIITPPKQAAVAVEDDKRLFPVRRIFCVGRNYADHAREMGADPDRELPFFFCKPADALVADTATATATATGAADDACGGRGFSLTA